MPIIRASEYIPIPIKSLQSAILDVATKPKVLDIRPELLASGFIRIEKRDLGDGRYQDCITPTGIIGLVPLNEHVSLWVEPKVPIANLDLIVKENGGIVPDSFTCLRSYLSSENDSDDLQSFVARSFIHSVLAIRESGLWKDYVREDHSGSSMSGRIVFSRTMRQFASRGVGYNAVTNRFVKTALIEPNICIKYALDYLSAIHAQNDELFPQIRDLVYYFERNLGVRTIQSRPSFNTNHYQIPAAKSAYRSALVLAETVTSGRSIDLSSKSGNLLMSNLAINMSSTFEAYMRRSLENADGHDWLVLDGNKLEPPIRLFEDKSDTFQNSLFNFATNAAQTAKDNPMNPDIIICRQNNYSVIADVKYKPVIGGLSAKRKDVEQVVTYATRLGVSNVLTIHPCQAGQRHGLFYSGSIGSVNVFCFLFDLSSTDMESEKRVLFDSITALSDAG